MSNNLRPVKPFFDVLVVGLVMGCMASGCGARAAVSSPPARFHFRNVATAAGLDFRHRSGAAPRDILRTTGSGLAWLDYDGDAWPDLFCVNDAPPGAERELAAGHRLFRNRGDGTFEDVTGRAGVRGSGQAGMGVAVGDFDGDGAPDLYVTCFGSNRLYRNRGDGTFGDVTDHLGAGGGARSGDSPKWSTAAAWFDADADGDLDLYVANYCRYGSTSPRYCTLEGVRTACPPSHYAGQPDLFFRNEGGKRLVSDGRLFSLRDRPPGRGLGVLPLDAEGDGRPDLFVANDGGGNFYFRGHADRYLESGYASGLALDGSGADPAGMGVDAADVDRDGLPDLLLANFQEVPNLLYRQVQPHLFRDVSLQMGFGLTTRNVLTFGAGFADFDLDGRLEALFVNGHVQDNIQQIKSGIPWAQEPQLFTLDVAAFRNVSDVAGPAFQQRIVGRGAAFADYDRDGDEDVAVSVNGGPMQLWRNDSARGHWLQVELRGRRPNSQAIGAEVRLRAAGVEQARQVLSGRSYLSDSERVVTFGLGKVDRVEALEVRWPGGARQTVPAPAIDRRIVVKQERP